MAQIKRKSSLYFLMSLACFTMASSLCLSLPSVPVAQSGTVEVKYLNSHTMLIKASDDAILHYEDFQVGPGEEVRFEQSAASHHILGKNPSQILGSIQSAGKVVFVNTNGFFFGPSSQTKVQKLQVEGSQICVQGSIDGTSMTSTGGEVHLFGQEILLQGAKIDVSGLLGGGEVLIGGEFQGTGTTPYASKVIMDEVSEIRANAIESGDGGLVVLWSQDQTLFAGKILAQGGVLQGSGGLVETSSQGHLDIRNGKVDTLDAKGEAGQWLLDPFKIEIMTGGTGCSSTSSTCSESCPADTACYGGTGGNDCKIDPSFFLGATSHISLIASTQIIFRNSFSLTSGKSGFVPNLTMSICNSDGYFIVVTSPTGQEVKVTTDGGKFTLTHKNTGPSFFMESPFSIDTTNGGKYPEGADITGIYAYCISGVPYSLTIDAGTSGLVSFCTTTNAASGGIDTKALGKVNVKHAQRIETTGVATNKCEIILSAPVYVANGAYIDTGGKASITLGSLDGLVENAAVTFNTSSSGNASAPLIINGPIGANTPIQSFTIGSKNAQSVTCTSVTTAGGSIAITPPATLTGSSIAMSSSGGDITFTSLAFADSNPSLSFHADSDSLSTLGIVSLPQLPSTVKSIDVIGSTVTIGNAVTATDGVSIAKSTTVSINGGISSSNASVSIEGALTVNGDISANGSIFIGSALHLQKAATIAGPGGISIGGDIDCGIEVYDLTLTASSTSPIFIESVYLKSLNVTSASEFSFSNLTITGGSLNIASPSVVKKNGGTISSGGGNIVFQNLVRPNDDNIGSNLTISTLTGSTLGTLSVQGLGSESASFGDIKITGSSIALGGSIWASKSITFSDPISIVSNTIIQGLGGITIPGAITAVGSTPLDLTLDAGSYGLTIPSLGSSSAPFGAVTIKSSNLSLNGDMTSNASIFIGAPISISQTTTLTAPSGISITGAVSANSGTPSLTLLASSGPLEAHDLGSTTSPLGTVSLTASYITLGGSITSNASIALSGAVTITNSVTLTASSNVTLNQDLSRSTDPFNLTIKATSGTVSVQNLGSSNAPLGNISITAAGSLTPKNLVSSGNIDLSGAAITLDVSSTVSASGNITINNTGLLTIPAGSLSVKGNFAQTTESSVALGTSIETAGKISFAGPLTITGSTVLRGTQGITLSKSITPGSSSPDLTLDAGSQPLTVVFAGADSNPFGAISIQGSNLTLQGNMYSNTSIVINPPIKITADTIINSLNGYGGLALLKPVTASSGNPSLTVYAANALVDVESLGSDEFPLGTISLTGSYVTLNGSIVSSSAVEITGAVTITENLTLIGSSGVTLKNQLLPSTNPFDLTLQACDGSVSVQSLGNSVSPLKNVSLIGVNGVTVSGTITTTGILTIVDEEGTTTCGSGTYPPCNSQSQ